MSTFIERMLGGNVGDIVTIEPDYIVINDGISNAAVEEISTVAAPEKVLVIYDHDVPTGRPEAAEILKKNLKFAQNYGCLYIQAQGVGYQYMLKNMVKEKQIILGGGSHGSIFGAKQALGIDVSIPELARAVETDRYSTVVPETVYISVEGSLNEGISAMDLALKILSMSENIKGKAIEFYVPGLSQHEREVLCSMGTLTGAFCAALTDKEPESALKIYAKDITPMIIEPCEERRFQSEARISEKIKIQGQEFQAGQIGGYTGGTIEELRKAAELIEGKELALGFRLTVCPATGNDYVMAAKEGILSKFIDFGAQISAVGDHSVVVQGPGAMGPGENLITTGLYTFSGAMGCEDAKVYTASVESVIAAAISKRI